MQYTPYMTRVGISTRSPSNILKIHSFIKVFLIKASDNLLRSQVTLTCKNCAKKRKKKRNEKQQPGFRTKKQLFSEVYFPALHLYF